ncbi:hypothetical protein TNCT_319041 [Trichonephila clavata]|uniref:Uncharacterized protein n=1 Tax=Trichonephila clavata TaxID=2740835 RepID=A0A8X6HT45_TRICU|nr:hypothetical protein TNCT_319041 [Trichonephila clavata]
MVADVARAGLLSAGRKKTRAEPDLFSLAEFLNGSTSGCFSGESSDYSISSRARHTTQRLSKNNCLEWAALEVTDSLVLFIRSGS